VTMTRAVAVPGRRAVREARRPEPGETSGGTSMPSRKWAWNHHRAGDGPRRRRSSSGSSASTRLNRSGSDPRHLNCSTSRELRQVAPAKSHPHAQSSSANWPGRRPSAQPNGSKKAPDSSAAPRRIGGGQHCPVARWSRRSASEKTDASLERGCPDDPPWPTAVWPRRFARARQKLQDALLAAVGPGPVGRTRQFACSIGGANDLAAQPDANLAGCEAIQDAEDASRTGTSRRDEAHHWRNTSFAAPSPPGNCSTPFPRGIDGPQPERFTTFCRLTRAPHRDPGNPPPPASWSTASGTIFSAVASSDRDNSACRRKPSPECSITSPGIVTDASSQTIAGNHR